MDEDKQVNSFLIYNLSRLYQLFSDASTNLILLLIAFIASISILIPFKTFLNGGK